MPSTDIRRSAAPFFYKYRSCADLERLEGILLRNEIYFASPGQLDDDLEARPRLTATSTQALAALLFNVWMQNHPGTSREALAAEFAKVLHGLKWITPAGVLQLLTEGLHLKFSEHRILSLSTRYDIDDCWERYGDSHRGCCIEFANSGALFGLSMRVVYGDEFSIDVTDPEQVTADFLFHKTRRWRQQLEARVIGVRGAPQVHHFDPKVLRRVILGKDISQETRATVFAIAARREQPVDVVAAELDVRHRLVLVPCAERSA